MVVACSARYEVGNSAGGKPGTTEGEGGTEPGETGGAAVTGGVTEPGSGGRTGTGGSTGSGAATSGGVINTAGGATASAGAPGAAAAPAGLAACNQPTPASPTVDLADPVEIWQRLTTFLYGESFPAPPAPYLPRATSYSWIRETALKMLHGELTDAGLPEGPAPVLANLIGSWIPDRVAAERYAEPLLAADGKLSSLWWAPDPDEPHRIGLLTDPSLLARQRSISARGTWMNEHVFCTPVPAQPAGIDFAVPAVPGLTGRQELEAALSEPSCRGCHSLVDPPGFSLEHFDAMGEYRTSDDGQPVNASGIIVPASLSSYAEVFGFTDVEDLAKQLGDSCLVGRCFSQQVWTDAVERGRERLAPAETWAGELETIHLTFAADDYSVDSLISAVVISASFAGAE